MHADRSHRRSKITYRTDPRAAACSWDSLSETVLLVGPMSAVSSLLHSGARREVDSVCNVDFGRRMANCHRRAAVRPGWGTADGLALTYRVAGQAAHLRGVIKMAVTRTEDGCPWGK